MCADHSMTAREAFAASHITHHTSQQTYIHTKVQEHKKASLHAERQSNIHLLSFSLKVV